MCAIFADDNTLYACDISLKNLIEKLESSASAVINWFGNNYMKLNNSKCHLLVCDRKEEIIVANIGNSSIVESDEVKLLGITIDHELKFKSHLTSICKRAGKKNNALTRLCKILTRIILMKAFFISQFSFSPSLAMFCDRAFNSNIDSLHYRALKIVYRDNLSSFDELLRMDNSVRVHHRNIQCLAIEMFKVKWGIAPNSWLLYSQKEIFQTSKLCKPYLSGLGFL